MSILHIRQIKNQLHKIFSGLIDESDLSKRKGEDKEKAFLSRALAAYAILSINNTNPTEAAKSIIDGFDDNGIDAIHYSPILKQLTIVQSKWIDNGKGVIDYSSVLKFLQGAKDIIDCNFGKFNEKIKPFINIIQDALYDFELKINLVVLHTGRENSIPNIAKEALEDYIALINDNGDESNTDDKVSLIHWNQASIYSNFNLINDNKKPINLEGMIHQWGKINEPYYAISGYITADQVSTWWNNNKKTLFSKNIRNMLGKTAVNDEIKKTLITSPELFWYFNNGITIIADSIRKSTAHGNTNEAGVFCLKNANIVNGAQTVSTIGTIKDIDKENLAKALIPIKIISLQHAPEDFGKQVTKNTNTQNKIENIDFVSLDPEQIRIRNELELESIKYIISRGEDLNESDQNIITINEAITALACLNSLELAVQAKREIGVLEDTLSKQYKLIFNNETHGIHIKNAVSCFRKINVVIENLKNNESFKSGLLIHGNRFITHALFHKFSISPVSIIDESFDEQSYDFEAGAVEIITKIDSIIQKEYSETAVLASLFKNGKKCNLIFNKIFDSN